ncbi:hypothetical protein [Labilibaculum sp.]|uniref:hypothetical protein n=1 Tax=Labilibaculum sp. TaxID=2060723 RepID=UPI0035667927
MNQHIYILIGICILTFLVGNKLRQLLSGRSAHKNTKARKKAKKTTSVQSPTSIKKEKLKLAFLYIQLIIVFALLIFMIPALSRDILSTAQIDNQNLLLRILIVVFAIYILVMGFLKIRKTPKSKK